MRDLDPCAHTTPELLEAIVARMPDAGIEEIIAALSQVAEEEQAEHDALLDYARRTGKI